MAETVVEAFPEEEESVRGALREKYNLLLQRLRQSSVLGMNNCLAFNFPQKLERPFFCTEQRPLLSVSFFNFYSVFILQRGGRGSRQVDEDCDSGQTQTEEEASGPTAETPRSDRAAPVGGEGG